MEARKKILILFGSSPWNDQSPAMDQKYRLCYEYLYEMAEKNGAELCRASIDWYDRQRKIFTRAWTFKDGQWTAVSDIKPDLVYDKTRLCASAEMAKEIIAKDYRIINDPAFTAIVNNKLCVSLIFPQYLKKNHLVKNSEDLVVVSEKLKGEKIVLKPMSGSGGKDIHIINEEEAKIFSINRPYIAQEFIDGSSGIEGIVEGLHDLRLVFVDEELVYSYVRQPKKGSFLSNLAQGGSMFIVKKEKLPESLSPLIKKVQETFSCFSPKVYTIDLIFDADQRPWIVEMNTMPGIYFSPDQKEWQDKFYSKLINIYLTA